METKAALALFLAKTCEFFLILTHVFPAKGVAENEINNSNL